KSPFSPGLASGLFLRSANVTSVALDKAKPPTFYRDSLTHTGKCHGTISARPELPYCGSTTSAIREGPRGTRLQEAQIVECLEHFLRKKIIGLGGRMPVAQDGAWLC